jgi:hypothetical protein
VGPDELSVLKFLLALIKKGNMMEKEDMDKYEGIEEVTLSNGILGQKAKIRKAYLPISMKVVLS